MSYGFVLSTMIHNDIALTTEMLMDPNCLNKKSEIEREIEFQLFSFSCIFGLNGPEQ